MPEKNEPRKFHVGAPVLRFSKSTSPTRLIRWDLFNNDPHLVEFNWYPHHQCPPTKADNGTVYTHIDGSRMRAVLQFEYWHQDYANDNISNPHGPGFTEWDYQYIIMAQTGTTFDMEFFPFEELIEPARAVPDVRFQCYLPPEGGLIRTRSEKNIWKWDCTLTAVGTKIVTSGALPV